MEDEENVLKFIETLSLDPQGIVLISQLLDATESQLVGPVEISRFVLAATRRWLKEAERGLPVDSGPVAVEAARKTSGHVHNFPGREPIDPSKLKTTRFLAQTFEALRTYQFELTAPISDGPIAIETCSPSEFNAAAQALLENLQRRAAGREPVVKPGASLGAPAGVVWTTHTVIDPLDRPSIPTASEFWERLGLVDYSWTAGRGLFVYAIDSALLGESFRPTPIEGFNRRFRQVPFKADDFKPFGATVNMRGLKETLNDGGKIDDDGVPECVSRPLQPSEAVWADLIRDLRFAGALSMIEDQAHVTELQFQTRVLRGKDPAARAAAFVELLRSADATEPSDSKQPGDKS